MCFIVYVTFTDVISFNPYCSPKRQAGMICSTLSIRNLGFTKVKLLAQGHSQQSDNELPESVAEGSLGT